MNDIPLNTNRAAFDPNKGCQGEGSYFYSTCRDGYFKPADITKCDPISTPVIKKVVGRSPGG